MQDPDFQSSSSLYLCDSGASLLNTLLEGTKDFLPLILLGEVSLHFLRRNVTHLLPRASCQTSGAHNAPVEFSVILWGKRKAKCALVFPVCLGGLEPAATKHC